jgi:hypothetical protein
MVLFKKIHEVSSGILTVIPEGFFQPQWIPRLEPSACLDNAQTGGVGSLLIGQFRVLPRTLDGSRCCNEQFLEW